MNPRKELVKDSASLKEFLDRKAFQYESIGFSDDDPLCIPKRYTDKKDMEIAGLFAALLAWGNRKSIIDNCSRLMDGMGNDPHGFVTDKKGEGDVRFKPLLGFVHRTFNATDLMGILNFLEYHYKTKGQDSLETAFFPKKGMTVEEGLNGFHRSVFQEADHRFLIADRTQKHIAAPFKKSACKRLNMFLRWMVRSAEKGTDLGLWKNIGPADLICPLDVHVIRVANKLGLLESNKGDWKTALQLTARLKEMDPLDPVKYDFALFGLGAIEKVL